MSRVCLNIMSRFARTPGQRSIASRSMRASSTTFSMASHPACFFMNSPATPKSEKAT
jgi:hypothetical protein